MAKLKDYGWWPTDWHSEADKPPNTAEVSARGAFAACTHSESGLMIEGLCDENTRFSAVISHSAGVDLEQLERIFDGCRGMRMSAVEDLNLNLQTLRASNESPVSRQAAKSAPFSINKTTPVFNRLLGLILIVPAIWFGWRRKNGARADCANNDGSPHPAA